MQEVSRILGPDGAPIRKAELLREIATPSLEGIRNVWFNSVACGLTPDGLVDLLRKAAEGDADNFLTLSEEMEERDLHYLGVMGDRKRALSGLDITVESPTDDAADVALADAVRDMVALPIFYDLAEDLQDALGKSYAVSEIMWDTSERQWMPKRFAPRDQRWFFYHRERRHELRLRDIAAPTDGLLLQPFKFIHHQPRIKAGIPIRNGFARIAGFAWICKLYALKDWMAFAEVFGMPLRLGRYGPNASREDVAVLKRAVANIGTDAAAVLPDSMKIEFKEAAKGQGGADVFERLCDYLDKQMSKAILGQTMTTDNGGSLAQAKVHNEVRLDILAADAKGLAQTLNRDLVKPFIDLNFGPQKRYPKMVIKVPKPENITALTAALKDLVPLGLEVEQSVIRDMIGIPEPAPGAVLLRLAATPPQAGKEDSAVNQAQQRRALNAQLREDQQRDEVDEIVAESLEGWEGQIDPLIAPIEALAEACSSFEEFKSRLADVGLDIDLEAIQLALATASFKARGLGDTRDLQQG